MNSNGIQDLPDSLYHLREAGAALEVNGFLLHVNATDEGLIVDIYDDRIIRAQEDYDRAHLGSVMAEHCDREDPDSRPRDAHAEILGDALYRLTEDTAAFNVEGFRIHVFTDEEGLTVDLFDAGPILERGDYENSKLGSTMVANAELSSSQGETRDALESSMTQSPSGKSMSGPS